MASFSPAPGYDAEPESPYPHSRRSSSVKPAVGSSLDGFTWASARYRKRHNPILGFHKQMIRDIASPQEDDLLILAKGLGLRRVICNLLKLYDGEKNLVLLVNCSTDDEAGLGEELSTMGVRKPGLRVVGYEMAAKTRKSLYESGGLISVTSRILVVDLLTKNIPTELITGMVVLHAERVPTTSLEAFIVRLYRQVNRNGFLKAFSDEPEMFTYGLSPLQTILKTLCMRRVHLWPRFHEKVHESLGERRADVIELYQPLSPLMTQIQSAIVECMEATLAELRRSNTNLDLDDFTIDNALFRSFDRIVRRQLDPVWHRVGPKTKKLVADLGDLRKLLSYLLSYDAVLFNSYLDTIIASNSTARGTAKQNQSPWLFLDAANVLLQCARKRVYIKGSPPTPVTEPETPDQEEEDWEAMNEMESSASGAGARANGRNRVRSTWPNGIQPVLEEQPKWLLLSQVLDEIETEITYGPIKDIDSEAPGNNAILVMCDTERNCAQLREYLSTMKPYPLTGGQPSALPNEEKPGRRMMERYLRNYLFWKASLSGDRQAASDLARAQGEAERQDRNNPSSRGGRPPPNKRRRVRGGSVAATSSTERNKNQKFNGEREIAGERELERETEEIARDVASGDALGLDNLNEDEELRELDTLPAQAAQNLLAPSVQVSETDVFDDSSYDEYFGLVALEDTVIVRSYGGDEDELVLQEIRPRFVVMYDADPAFVRRVEIYRSCNPGLAVRVYFMMYSDSVEERRYLAGLRKEKDAFERLIKEKATMVIPITGDPRAPPMYESRARTLSTRVAGGGVANVEPARVIIDMREFRSTLPSLLHAGNIQVIPATLQVGDYIIAPTMCVERKSVPDLIQSFNSGRLYTQCEAMSIHYAQPILLIEFEENKSFQLQTIAESRSTALTTTTRGNANDGKGTSDKPAEDAIDPFSLQSKLVLLTLTFPRLRIIWSSSAHATVDIIADLKMNHPEPDVEKAIVVGADDEAGAGVDLGTGGEGTSAMYNQIPTEMLRTIPGVSSRNWKLVAGRVGSIRELCEAAVDGTDDGQAEPSTGNDASARKVKGIKRIAQIVGSEDAGKAAHEFITKDIRERR